MQYIQNLISQININLRPIKKVFKTLKTCDKKSKTKFYFSLLENKIPNTQWFLIKICEK